MNENIIPPSKLVPGVPPGLEQVILKATEKLQVKRYATAADMKVALDNVAHLMAVFPDVVPGRDEHSYPPADEKNVADEKEDEYDDNDEWDEDDEDELAALVGGRTEKDRYRKPKSTRPDKKKKRPLSAAERRRKKQMIISIALGVLMALIIVIGAFFIINHLGNNSLITPKLIGMTEEEAKDAVTELGLKFKVGEPVFSDDVTEGKVAEQTPEKGIKSKKGDTVTVRLSKGADAKTKDAKVPDVVGKSKANAQYSLEDSGFVLGEITKEDSEKPIDTVIRQTPKGGSSAAEGSTVDIVVSLGPKATEVEMPNLLGLTEIEAKTALKNADLLEGEVDTASSDEYPKGQVIWQQYKEGALLSGGQKVSYTVSTGPATKSGTVTIDIDLSDAPTEEVKVMVKVVNFDGSTDTVFDENCLQASGSVQVPCQGKGEGKIMVYFNSELIQEYKANFGDGTYAKA
jgi:serine/threonine-protein kinase